MQSIYQIGTPSYILFYMCCKKLYCCPSTWSTQSWSAHLSELGADLLHVFQHAFILGVVVRKVLDLRHQGLNSLHVLTGGTYMHRLDRGGAQRPCPQTYSVTTEIFGCLCLIWIQCFSAVIITTCAYNYQQNCMHMTTIYTNMNTKYECILCICNQKITFKCKTIAWQFFSSAHQPMPDEYVIDCFT